MKRARRLLGLAVLALVLLYAAVQIYDYVDVRGPVYTMAQVRRGLRNHPRAWVGRSVLVRGIISEHGFDRECEASVCQATLFYEELGGAAAPNTVAPAHGSRVLGMPQILARLKQLHTLRRNPL